jgi:hypothetical protein
VVDPHHPLYGKCYPVSERESGRGPSLIVIRLPDGRERSIPRSATVSAAASDAQAAPGSGQAQISVRTLLPLANHVRAVLASRDADFEGGGRTIKQPTAGRDGVAGRAAAPVVTASRRDAASTGAAAGTARATSAPAVRPIRGGGGSS